MSEDTETTDAGEPRAGRRDGPIIEGEAIRTEPPRAAGRPGLAAAAPGVAALLLSGAALWFALHPSTPPGPSSDDVARLGQRLGGLESRLGALEAKPAPAPPPAAPDVRPDLARLSARIDALDAATQAARADAGRALQQAQNPPRPPEPPRVDLAPLEQRIGRLEAAIGPLRDALAAPKTQVRATENPDVAAGGVASGDAPALAVAAESLRQQLERGAPFTRELDALGRLGVDPARLAALRPLAAEGAPTAARLAQDFDAVSPAVLRAARPASSGGDLMDRLARSASTLVRIRPAGDDRASGDDAPALVSRIEAALARGDVAAAVALYDRLPAEAQAPARDWAARSRARAEADAAARSLVADALDKLARK